MSSLDRGLPTNHSVAGWGEFLAPIGLMGASDPGSGSAFVQTVHAGLRRHTKGGKPGCTRC